MGLSTEQIEEILDKLNDDVDFRDQLVCDAGSVLDDYDISYNQEDLASPSEVKLPSIGEVNANRDAFRDALFPDNEFFWNSNSFVLPDPTS